jgi:hypothetical protein
LHFFHYMDIIANDAIANPIGKGEIALLRMLAVGRALGPLILVSILALLFWSGVNTAGRVVLGLFLALAAFAVVESVLRAVERTREEEVWYEGYTPGSDQQDDDLPTARIHVITAAGERKTYWGGRLPPLIWSSIQPGWVIIRLGTRTRSLYDILPAGAGLGERPTALEQSMVLRSRSVLILRNAVVPFLSTLFGAGCASPLFLALRTGFSTPEGLEALTMGSPFLVASVGLFWLAHKTARPLFRDLVNSPLDLTGALIHCQEVGPMPTPGNRSARLKLTLWIDGQAVVVRSDQTFPWAEYVGKTLRVQAMAGSGEVLSATVRDLC